MTRAGVWLVLVLLMGGSAPAAFAAVAPCNKTTEVAVAGYTELSARPARLCGVAFFATGSNGYCHVYDSPGNAAHGQSLTIAEPGAATSGNSAAVGFGDNGYPTQFGLGAYAINGRCIILWGATP